MKNDKTEWIKELWNGFAIPINSLLKFEVKPISIMGKEIFGGLTSYNEHNFTFIVEHIAEKRIEAEEHYKRHLREIEEVHRNRLERNPEKPERVKSCACV